MSQKNSFVNQKNEKNSFCLIFDDFENPWQRGGHDPDRIVDLLINAQL